MEIPFIACESQHYLPRHKFNVMEFSWNITLTTGIKPFRYLANTGNKNNINSLPTNIMQLVSPLEYDNPLLQYRRRRLLLFRNPFKIEYNETFIGFYSLNKS